jgi:predicted metallopeptidase
VIPAHSFSRRKPSRQASEGLDFTGRIRQLCKDMAERTPQLAHVDMQQVAVGFTQARKATAHGLYASLTPLRFAGGKTFSMRRGRKWGVQRLFAEDGQEMLYVMTFYLPRFLNLPFREKLTTVMHELWHIGPEFDGDLRRFKGRCFAHGGSQKQFDAHVANLLDQWLQQSPPVEILDFLRCDFAELTARYGRVFGHRIRAPKLIPIG